MTLSNYPPGVSGNEPEITGDHPVDRHNPWHIFFDSFEPDVDPQWWLEDLRDINTPYIPMKDEESARRVVDERNAMIPNECRFRGIDDPDDLLQVCDICGEVGW